MHRLLTIGAACVSLVVVAGCGSDSSDGGSNAAQAPAAETTAPDTTAGTPESRPSTSSAGGDTIEVHMKGFAFTPAEIAGKVGQTVKWTNDDSVPHNAVAESGDLKTDTFQKGGSATYELDQAGTINYICTVHPQMKGTITVTE